LSITDILTRSTQADLVARRERAKAPEQIQAARAVRHPAGLGVRRARVKTTPGAVPTVLCTLDSISGEEVTVTCDICNGSELNAASPRLVAGDWIMVAKFGAAWRCMTTFQSTRNCVCTPA